MEGKTTHLVVRAGHEWGEFFVHEEPIERRSDGQGFNASASWTCNSSFGTYGHYWGSMGRPFGEFIKDIGDDYLLGKIATKVYDADKLLDSVLYNLNSRLDEGSGDKKLLRAAIKEAKKLHAECEFDAALPMLFYESVPLSKVRIEWCDMTTQIYPQQAVMFVKKLWPLFVAEFNKTPEPANA